MSISEQVKELRELANSYYGEIKNHVSTIEKAADTIESLSAKLQAANMECQKGNYSLGDLSELIDKFDNEKIKGITDFEQVQIFNALKYLDMYQKVGTIEKFMELKQNMEQSAEDCGGWISCKERLPETDGIYWAVVTLPKPVEKGYSIMEAEEWYDNYTLEELCEWEKTAPKHTGFARFENGDWRTHTKRRFTNVIAWQPIVEPEPYHEP